MWRAKSMKFFLATAYGLNVAYSPFMKAVMGAIHLYGPTTRRIADQNSRFGLFLPRSQFSTIPGLTPSRSAKRSRDSPLRNLASNSDLPNNSRSEAQGGESTLTARITRWQKGFRSDPFRQGFQNHFNNAKCICEW
jgi:hypothetical protein